MARGVADRRAAFAEAGENGKTERRKAVMARKKRNRGKGSLFKRDGWYYYKKIEDGRTFCRSCRTKVYDEAVKAAEEFDTGADLPREARLAAVKEFLKPKGTNPDLAQAFETFAKHPHNAGAGEETLAALRSHWETLVRWLRGWRKDGGPICIKGRHPAVKRIGQVTDRIAAEFVDEKRATVSPNTLNKYIATYMRVWKACGAEESPWGRAMVGILVDMSQRWYRPKDFLDVSTLLIPDPGIVQ